MEKEERLRVLVKAACSDVDIVALKKQVESSVEKANEVKKRVIEFVNGRLRSSQCTHTEWFYDIAEHALILDDYVVGRTKQNSALGAEMEKTIAGQVLQYLQNINGNVRQLDRKEMKYGTNQRQDIGFEYDGREAWIQVKHGLSWQNLPTVLGEREKSNASGNKKYYLLALSIYEKAATLAQNLGRLGKLREYESGRDEWIFLGYVGNEKTSVNHGDWYGGFLDNVAKFLRLGG